VRQYVRIIHVALDINWAYKIRSNRIKRYDFILMRFINIDRFQVITLALMWIACWPTEIEMDKRSRLSCDFAEECEQRREYYVRFKGRAIAQAVSRWLPTAAARVRARVWSSWICGGQNGAGAGFLRVLRFPLPIFIPPIARQSPSSIIWDCTIGQKWPQYLVT
jgi:hypothetical protein